MAWTTSACSVVRMTSVPRRVARAMRSGTTSEAHTFSMPRWWAIRVHMSPIGPSPRTSSVPPGGTAAYCTACHAVGRTSER